MPAHSQELCEGAGQSKEGVRVGAPSAWPAHPQADTHRSPSLMSGLRLTVAKTSSRLGILTVAATWRTTFVAVIVGIIMVSIIHPGGRSLKEMTEQGGKPIMSSATPCWTSFGNPCGQHPVWQCHTRGY